MNDIVNRRIEHAKGQVKVEMRAVVTGRAVAWYWTPSGYRLSPPDWR